MSLDIETNVYWLNREAKERDAEHVDAGIGAVMDLVGATAEVIHLDFSDYEDLEAERDRRFFKVFMDVMGEHFTDVSMHLGIWPFAEEFGKAEGIGWNRAGMLAVHQGTDIISGVVAHETAHSLGFVNSTDDLESGAGHCEDDECMMAAKATPTIRDKIIAHQTAIPGYLDPNIFCNDCVDEMERDGPEAVQRLLDMRGFTVAERMAYLNPNWDLNTTVVSHVDPNLTG